MYTNLQLFLWVFFHVASLFWSVKFPYHYHSYQINGRIRYVHATILAIGILIPLVPALVPFSDAGFGYSFAVPPVFCTPTKLSLYAVLLGLPYLVLFVITLVLLLNVFWIVVKVTILVPLHYNNKCTLQNLQG